MSVTREMRADLTGLGRPWSGELRSLVARFVDRALEDPDVHKAPPAEGDPALRRALARLLDEPEGDLYVTTGVRDAAYALARTLGDRVFTVETPGFSGVADALLQGGARVTSAAWHEMTGPRPPVRSVAGAEPVRWLTPFARNPDGACISATRRAALESRIRGGAVVVCNEIYRWHSARRTHVTGAVRVGSLSKVVGGGTRLGWISAPPLLAAAIVPKLVARPPTVWQRAWAHLLREEGIGPFVEGVVTSDLAARDAFLAEAAQWTAVPATADGVSLLWEVSGTEHEVVARTADAGVVLGAGADFGSAQPAVRLSFAGVTREGAVLAARRLAPLLSRNVLIPRSPEGL
ncbi:aminotransferase class I/II-fold pyridoxal phosphate-dependent enzyme [Streptomyces prunicolor]|uniref:aminotransferase class I/II-fold pyridoxal phosphate-dependent enzyme n=1 Tax=Streptomyces prunicolor TaxID=67348 RepID=UPI003433E91B